MIHVVKALTNSLDAKTDCINRDDGLTFSFVSFPHIWICGYVYKLFIIYYNLTFLV